MNMQKVMEKRRSVREYKTKDLDSNDLDALRALIDRAPQAVSSVQVKFHLVKEGKRAFETLSGVAGYNGVMIEAPHYLVILANDHVDKYKAAGYTAEWLVLNLTKMDVGCCWIDGNKQEAEIKSVLGLETTDEVIALLAIGYGDSDIRFTNMHNTMRTGSVSSLTSIGYPHVDIEYAKEPTSGRMSIVDMVYLNKWNEKLTIEELEQRGIAEAFFYMRLAPSWGNQQPWRFILSKGQIILTVLSEYGANDSRIAEIDAGIAMLYFETAMHSDGFPGSWKFGGDLAPYDIPETYVVAGIYSYT